LNSPISVLTILLAGLLAGGPLATTESAQSAATTPAPAQRPSAANSVTRYQPNKFPKRATEYYGLVWGVDQLSVKFVESGEIIRFKYHVLNSDKAKGLNDKNDEPSLIDPEAGVKLVVPALENVGTLRQSGTPEAGKSYWMAFSNSGRRVKPGDRVSVVIGRFHADGLVVE
jgi:hypothetical protein